MTDIHERLRGFWDADSEVYDRSPSHALTDPVEAAAWRAVLSRWLPPAPASVLDAGAGTGSLSLLLLELGHRVTALDISPGMLAKATAKAGGRGFELSTVTSPATEPPSGPFDAVVERHLLWTTPDPQAALAAWRRAAPDGTLVLFEGLWARKGPGWAVRNRLSGVVRRARGVHHDHHGAYEPDLVASLPLARIVSPSPLIEAAERAGWRSIRIERLRDVEWARRLAEPYPIGWLEGAPQYALIARAR
jgi:SAM-dependent methyltransferase